MVSKKDILEIKRRFKKEECTISRIAGCYVDSQRNKVTSFNENFLNLDEEEFYKYLDIAKKVLSGTLGNNLLELPFNGDYLKEMAAAGADAAATDGGASDEGVSDEGASEEVKTEVVSGSMQQYFLGLRASELKNDALLDRLYDQVIENYEEAGNYLILVYYDVYDIPLKTTDNLKLDESEEMFPYLLAAICPVNLSKPGLGYLADDNRIGPRIRDWVVDMPDLGFMFPSFSERSADIHSITFYLKDPKDSRRSFVETALGTMSKRTTTDQRLTFKAMVKSAISPVTGEDDEMFMSIQESLKELVPTTENAYGESIEDEEAVLTTEMISEVLSKHNIPDAVSEQIQESFKEVFLEEGEEVPAIKAVIDEKKLAATLKERHEEELEEKQKELTAQIGELQKELVDKNFNEVLTSDEQTGLSQAYDVILRVKPEKVADIHTETVDGQRCVVIPLKDGEYVNLNGIKTQL